MFERVEKRRRKGQFFIIAAVAIILILITLNATLNQSFLFDTAASQADRNVWTLLELQRQVNATIAGSAGASDALLLDRLQAVARTWERTLLLENVRLNSAFALTPTEVNAAFELRSLTAVLSKNVTFARI